MQNVATLILLSRQSWGPHFEMSLPRVATRSPDHTPYVFWLCSYMNSYVYIDRPRSLLSSKMLYTITFHRYPLNCYSINALLAVLDRFTAVLINNGYYTEKLPIFFCLVSCIIPYKNYLIYFSPSIKKKCNSIKYFFIKYL